MEELSYRGYIIRYMRSDFWMAIIYAPRTPRHLEPTRLTATLLEGKAILLDWAKAIVDVELTQGKTPR